MLFYFTRGHNSLLPSNLKHILIKKGNSSVFEELMVDSEDASCWENDNHNFKTILNGSSLAGWRMSGPGSFELDNNMIVTKGAWGSSGIQRKASEILFCL